MSVAAINLALPVCSCSRPFCCCSPPSTFHQPNSTKHMPSDMTGLGLGHAFPVYALFRTGCFQFSVRIWNPPLFCFSCTEKEMLGLLCQERSGPFSLYHDAGGCPFPRLHIFSGIAASKNDQQMPLSRVEEQRGGAPSKEHGARTEGEGKPSVFVLRLHLASWRKVNPGRGVRRLPPVAGR